MMCVAQMCACQAPCDLDYECIIHNYHRRSVSLNMLSPFSVATFEERPLSDKFGDRLVKQELKHCHKTVRTSLFGFLCGCSTYTVLCFCSLAQQYFDIDSQTAHVTRRFDSLVFQSQRKMFGIDKIKTTISNHMN